MPNPTPQPQPAPKPFAPAPGFSTLQQYIQAAATSVNTPSTSSASPAPSVPSSASAHSTTASPYSNLSALFHLAVTIFTAARAATRCLVDHYNARPHALTPDLHARLTYCTNRLQAIFHTLCHAPTRFLSAGQFRALYRAQAVLAHIWRQPVDFGPLIPWLTAPENCPAPARCKSSAVILPASSSLSLSTPRSALHSSDAPRSALPSSDAPRSALHSSDAPRSALRASSDPLLLQNPGRVLTSVLNHLAAIYGVAFKPVAVPRAQRDSSPAAVQATAMPANPPTCGPTSPSVIPPSPPAALRNPHSLHAPP